MVRGTDRVSRDPRCAAVVHDGYVLALPLTSTEVQSPFSLTGIAADIWKALDQEQPVKALASELAATVQTDGAQDETAIHDTVDQLISLGVLGVA